MKLLTPQQSLSIRKTWGINFGFYRQRNSRKPLTPQQITLLLDTGWESLSANITNVILLIAQHWLRPIARPSLHLDVVRLSDRLPFLIKV